MTDIYSATLRNLLTVTLLPFVLSGCTDGGSLRTSSSIIGEGWASPPEPYDPPALYCYSTLGAPDCHAVPLANAQTRAKGSYIGPPALPLEDIDNLNIDVETVDVSNSTESRLAYQNCKSVRQAPITSHSEEHSVIKTYTHNHPHQPINIHHHKLKKHKTVAQPPLLPAQH